MMKIDFKALAKKAVKAATPLVAALVAQKVLTGKLDIKSVLRDTARSALGDRSGA